MTFFLFDDLFFYLDLVETAANRNFKELVMETEQQVACEDVLSCLLWFERRWKKL